MQALYCHCGNPVYPDNRSCLNCGNGLGLHCRELRMISFPPGVSGTIHAWDGKSYRLCRNRSEHDACNGLVEVDSGGALCFACSLNRTIPNLSNPGNLERWRHLEQAKRRLVCGLSALDLPGIEQIRFDFLEDKRSNPQVLESFITTGHLQGVITINILEADDVHRTAQREMSGERYRTLLGHFRHEVGHYYFNILVTDRRAFNALFGNPDIDYAQAMQRYYHDGPTGGWETHYISAYASSHPYEDWAETFAHYLHVRDALETAHAFGLWRSAPQDFGESLLSWSRLSLALNEVSQALGRENAYPFIINQAVAEKLGYVDALVRLGGSATSA